MHTHDARLDTPSLKHPRDLRGIDVLQLHGKEESSYQLSITSTVHWAISACPTLVHWDAQPLATSILGLPRAAYTRSPDHGDVQSLAQPKPPPARSIPVFVFRATAQSASRALYLPISHTQKSQVEPSAVSTLCLPSHIVAFHSTRLQFFCPLYGAPWVGGISRGHSTADQAFIPTLYYLSPIHL